MRQVEFHCSNGNHTPDPQSDSPQNRYGRFSPDYPPVRWGGFWGVPLDLYNDLAVGGRQRAAVTITTRGMPPPRARDHDRCRSLPSSSNPCGLKLESQK